MGPRFRAKACTHLELRCGRTADLAKAGAATSPPPLAGEGQGEGRHARIPLFTPPHPSPASGRGSAPSLPHLPTGRRAERVHPFVIILAKTNPPEQKASRFQCPCCCAAAEAYDQ